MIKYEIYPKGKCQDVELDRTVRLQLVRDADGVVVRAVKENGDPLVGGNLVEFESNGKLYRYRGVTSELGFEMDGSRIKFSQE